MSFFKKTILLVLAVMISSSLFAQSSLKKANKQYELKAYNLAIKSYQKVLNRHKNNSVALNRIGDCYRHLNQMTEATKWYEIAVKQPKVTQEAFLNYGKSLKALGQYDDAKKWFLRYAQKYPVVGKHYARGCDFAIKNRNNPSNAEINNEFINTQAADFGMAIFKNRVVYASSRSDMKRGNGKSGKKNWAGGSVNQLFISERDANMFLRTPGFLHSDMKSQYNQGPVAYSPDGQWVAFTKNNFAEGTRHIPSSGMELGLYIASVEREGDFSEAQAFPYNGSGYSTGYPCFSDDGKTLYFASDRPDGFGGFDIYRSSRTGTSWSPPENLGSVVNSQGNEITPFYDGTSLHFASDWHDGLGGYDIFRAEQSGKRFTNIYHTGLGINSARDDYGYVYDVANGVGYLTSNRVGGKGGYDIYRVKRTTTNMIIHVVDKSGRPVQGASIDFSACGEGVYLTDASGLYSFQLRQGLNCSPIVRKQGFRSSSFKISDQATSSSQKVLLRRGKDTPSTNGGVVNNNPTNNNSTSNPSNNTDSKPNNETGGLSKDFLGFNGRVINEYTNVGLPNVIVRAINQNDRSVMETTTDASGSYIIALQANTPYEVTYNRSGYYDATRSVRTGNISDYSILGTTKIASTSGPRPNTSTPVAVNPPMNPTPPTNSGASTTTTSTLNGYSVQVASISANRNPDLTRFNSLSNIGTVYYAPVGNLYKVRVGTFATREEAKRATSVLKTRGYKDAFTVIEGNPNLATTTQPSGTYVDDEALVIPPSRGKYVVRLAAYSNPKKYFNRNSVLDLGSIAEQQKGQFTIMLLTGFTTLDQAARALAKAKDRGFRDAYLAEDINGVLKKMK